MGAERHEGERDAPERDGSEHREQNLVGAPVEVGFGFKAGGRETAPLTCLSSERLGQVLNEFEAHFQGARS